MIIRVIFIVLNLICFIVGAILLGIGIWANINSTALIDFVVKNEEFAKIEFDEDIEETLEALLNEGILKDSSYLLIVMGAIVVGISYIGCSGAWKESKLYLFIYTILMVAMIVAQVLLFFPVSEGNFLHDTARDVMRESMKPYKNRNATFNLLKLWEMASLGLQCCGVDGYKDFCIMKQRVATKLLFHVSKSIMRILKT